jgi:NIMA (never in mitosis gene a)-related kinase
VWWPPNASACTGVYPPAACDYGQACQSNSICTPTSTGTSVCACLAGYAQTPPGQVCAVQQQYYNASCAQGQSCLGGSVCNGSTCVCQANYGPVWSTASNAYVCQPQGVGVGASCANGETCPTSCQCTSSVCTCKIGSHAVFDGTTWSCVPNVAYADDSCASGQICSGGTVCNASQTCTCPSGQIPTTQVPGNIMEKVCVTATVSPSMSCSYGQFCANGSSCVNGICECPTNMPQVYDVFYAFHIDTDLAK